MPVSCSVDTCRELAPFWLTSLVGCSLLTFSSLCRPGRELRRKIALVLKSSAVEYNQEPSELSVSALAAKLRETFSISPLGIHARRCNKNETTSFSTQFLGRSKIEVCILCYFWAARVTLSGAYSREGGCNGSSFLVMRTAVSWMDISADADGDWNEIRYQQAAHLKLSGCDSLSPNPPTFTRLSSSRLNSAAAPIIIIISTRPLAQSQSRLSCPPPHQPRLSLSKHMGSAAGQTGACNTH